MSRKDSTHINNNPGHRDAGFDERMASYQLAAEITEKQAATQPLGAGKSLTGIAAAATAAVAAMASQQAGAAVLNFGASAFLTNYADSHLWFDLDAANASTAVFGPFAGAIGAPPNTAADIALRHYYTAGARAATVAFAPGAFLLTAGGPGFAPRLLSGVATGPARQTISSARVPTTGPGAGQPQILQTSFGGGHPSAPWQFPAFGTANSGYIGFGVPDTISGGLRYGWIQVTLGTLQVNSGGLNPDGSMNAAINAGAAPIPEPSIVSMIMGGASLMALRRRRRKQRRVEGTE